MSIYTEPTIQAFSRSQDGIECPPEIAGVEKTISSRNSKGKAREQPFLSDLDALHSPSSSREGAMKENGVSSVQLSATSVDELSATPRPPPQTTPTLPRRSVQTTHANHDTVISTRNSISHGISYNAINDVRALPSSSNVTGLQGKKYSNPRAQGKNSNAAKTGSEDSLQRLLHHDQVPDSRPNAKRDTRSPSMHGAQFGTVDIQVQSVSSPKRLVPESLASPVGEGSLSKATSITLANQPLPHASAVKSDAEEMRTKLLARLALEKNHAHASVPTDMPVNSSFGEGPDNSPRVDLNSACPGSPHRERSSTSSLPRSDGKSASGSSPGLIAQGVGDGADPESASGIVAEEARTREAKLRRRAQLRVRLAAEKRLADGS